MYLILCKYATNAGRRGKLVNRPLNFAFRILKDSGIAGDIVNIQVQAVLCDGLQKHQLLVASRHVLHRQHAYWRFITHSLSG